MTSDRRGVNPRTLQHRLDVLTLPVVALRAHGWVDEPDPAVCRDGWRLAGPVIGIGPVGDALAYWYSRDNSVAAVTRSEGSTAGRTTVIHGPPGVVDFVQPMPGGAVLLAASVTGQGRSGDEAQVGVWDADGHRVASGTFGDAVEHVLTTPSGQVWVGYRDEAIGPTGIARFGPDLSQVWKCRSGMPDHLACYALNVDGETATTYAYGDFHLTRIADDCWTDLGAAPPIGARAVLLDGPDGLLVGGYGGDYDVLTRVRVDADGVRAVGAARRVVLPDGLEISGTAMFCRGAQLHVLKGASWYRLSLSDVL